MKLRFWRSAEGRIATSEDGRVLADSEGKPLTFPLEEEQAAAPPPAADPQTVARLESMERQLAEARQLLEAEQQARAEERRQAEARAAETARADALRAIEADATAFADASAKAGRSAGALNAALKDARRIAATLDLDSPMSEAQKESSGCGSFAELIGKIDASLPPRTWGREIAATELPAGARTLPNPTKTPESAGASQAGADFQEDRFRSLLGKTGLGLEILGDTGLYTRAVASAKDVAPKS